MLVSMVGTVRKRVVNIVQVDTENAILLPDVVKRVVNLVGLNRSVPEVNSIYK
jgi:hypothetical protein